MILDEVRIELLVDSTRPLSGRVAAAGHDDRSFEGWLQLLRILADLLQPEEA